MGYLSKNYSQNLIGQETGSDMGELLALYGHEEILKRSCSLKPLVRFRNNFTRYSLVDLFQELFEKFRSVKT